MWQGVQEYRETAMNAYEDFTLKGWPRHGWPLVAWFWKSLLVKQSVNSTQQRFKLDIADQAREQLFFTYQGLTQFLKLF